MIAVHFGAGNIGRGFIAPLILESNYKLYFIDANEDIIDSFDESLSYSVSYADEEYQKKYEIDGIIHSSKLDEITPLIKKADLITSSVGPSALKHIAKTLALGLREKDNHCVIMACENMIEGSTYLKERLLEYNPNIDLSLIDFYNTAVDRIVPSQEGITLPNVLVEKYYELVVEGGENIKLNNIKKVDSLDAFIERKLFTVNTGHAVAAYYAHKKGYITMFEAFNDEDILFQVKAVLNETSQLLQKKHGFNEQEMKEYIDTTINRFRQKELSDKITRVARNPLRKLKPSDRLVKPAKEYVEAFHTNPRYLSESIAYVFKYESVDEEAKKIQRLIKEKGFEYALKITTGIQEHEILFEAIRDEYYKL